MFLIWSEWRYDVLICQRRSIFSMTSVELNLSNFGQAVLAIGGGTDPSNQDLGLTHGLNISPHHTVNIIIHLQIICVSQKVIKWRDIPYLHTFEYFAQNGRLDWVEYQLRLAGSKTNILTFSSLVGLLFFEITSLAADDSCWFGTEVTAIKRYLTVVRKSFFSLHLFTYDVKGCWQLAVGCWRCKSYGRRRQRQRRFALFITSKHSAKMSHIDFLQLFKKTSTNVST